MLDLNQGLRGEAYSNECGVVDTITADGVLAIAQDVTAIIEANKRAQNAVQHCGFRKPETFRQVADIPVAVIQLALAQGMDIMHDPDAMRRFLNDPDNRAFRTTLERV